MMQQPHPRLVVFTKAPVPGNAKTRLIPALGAAGAAVLAHRMLVHTLQHALAAHVESVELCMSPAPGHAAWQDVTLPKGLQCTTQGEGDLGERMAAAIERVTRRHHQPVLLMGTDCPGLAAELISEAACQLQTHDAVIVPVADGGYALIGLKSPCPELFTRMPWSTSTVAKKTLRRLAALGLSVWQGPVLHDIDEPADLHHLPFYFLTK